MSDFCELTRWNRDHTDRIVVNYDYFTDGRDVVCAEGLGFKFLTKHETLASVLSTNAMDNDEIASCHKEAVMSGDLVFYMELMDHSAYAFRFCKTYPKPTMDSGCAGIVIVPKSVWKKNWPDFEFTSEVVFKFLAKCLPENLIEAALNGWFYEAVFESTNPQVPSESYGGFISPEEALKEALNEHPECRFTEDEFEEKTEYRLIEKSFSFA